MGEVVTPGLFAHDPLEHEETHLANLGPRFLEALKLREAGKTDEAVDIFYEVLRQEPRLAEPRMELARVFLEQGRLEEAEEEGREAVRLLEGGGQWLAEIDEPVVQSLAWALLGEILKERASSDEVVFGDPDVFRSLIAESRAAYARAAELDPTDTASRLNALEMGEGSDEGEE